MSDQFVESAKAQMNVVERLLKGLPGISGYVDKDLRRDADKRLREGIALALEQSKADLMAVQNKLLKGGGLSWMDDVDEAVVKLQILIDRVKTASYGYAGLFDAVRIKEAQLDALNRFDQALAEEVGAIDDAITALGQAIADKGNVGAVIDRLTKTVADMNKLFDQRKEAVIAPDLLSEPGFAPDVAVAAPPADLPASDPAADIKNDPNAVG